MSLCKLKSLWLVGAILLLAPRPSFAAFTHYTTCTVQTGQVPSTQTNFPTLIVGTGCGTGATQFKSTGNGGNVQSTSGFDIRPYSGSCSGSALTYQLVTYSATAGTFEMYVLIASLADGGVVYLCYGDTTLTTDGSSTSTWPTTYKISAPLADAGPSTTIADFSQTGRNGTSSASTAATTSGQVDGAAQAAAVSSTAITFGTTAVPTTGSASWWFYPTWAKTDGVGHDLGFDAETSNLFETIHYTDNTIYAGWYNAGSSMDGRVSVASASYTLTQNAWNHFVLTWDSAAPATKLYLNGSQVGSTNTVNGTWSTSGATLSVMPTTAFAPVTGDRIDELELLDTVLAANTVTTIYNNQHSQTSFWTEGSDTSVGGGSASKRLTTLGAGE